MAAARGGMVLGDEARQLYRQATVAQKTYHHNWLTIISTFIAEMLLQKRAIKRYFIFPPRLASVSALPGETGNPRNCITSLKCCMLAAPPPKKTHTHKTLRLSRGHSFVSDIAIFVLKMDVKLQPTQYLVIVASSFIHTSRSVTG